MTPLESVFERDFSYIIKQTEDNKIQKKLPVQFRSTDPPKNNRIANVFYPLILLMKATLSCPVQIRRREGNVEYDFRYISLAFFLTFLGGVIFGFLIIVWSLNAIFEINWPVKIFSVINQNSNWLDETFLQGSHLIITLSHMIRASMPFGAWIITITQWPNLKFLCKFLNNWSRFCHQFDLTFSSYNLQPASRFNLTNYRNLVSAFWISPLLFVFPLVQPHNYLTLENPAFIGIIYGYIQMIAVCLFRSLANIRDYLLLYTLMKAYEEIRNGIQADYKNCREAISKNQVQDWMQLILFVRKQATHAEKCMSISNMWSIFEVFALVLQILSLVLFLFLNDKLFGHSSAGFLSFATVATFFLTFSVYWKARIAEGVTHMEEEIAAVILELETADCDCEGRLQMKLICDLIYDDPVSIQIGNMMTLNKRLLLSFFSQLASYLVVVLQFTDA